MRIRRLWRVLYVTPPEMLPLILSLVALAVFTILLMLGHIGEAAYCFLVAASALFGLVLHGFARLQELDLKNLRVVLRELQQTKQDMVVYEERLKAIALPLLQAMAYTGAAEGRMGSAESFAAKRQWYKRKLADLSAALNLSVTEAAEARKYTDKYDEIDRVLEASHATNVGDPNHVETKEMLKRLSGELDQMLRADAARGA